MIKSYNENNSYNDYSNSLVCDDSENCMNSFLHSLTEKSLDGVSSLTNELIINETEYTQCDIYQKLEEELSKLDIETRKSIEEKLEQLGYTLE